jgi:pyrroline-5-carboxylate reductase
LGFQETAVKNIGLVGAGNMGSALVVGLIRSGRATGDTVRVFDPDAARTLHLQSEYGIEVVESVSETVLDDTEILVLAVKPQVMAEVLNAVKSKIHDRPIVLSIAAGITTDFILSGLHAGARVIRAMPNAPAMLGQGATALCKAGAADDRDLEEALEIFASVGVAVAVEEKMMNVVTALSASGPGYLFAIMEALTDGAVRMGMDRGTARELAVTMVKGSAAMAEAENVPFSELKDRITSPGGTTMAGLQVLERAGLRGTIMDVIEAATKRGDELASG